MWSFERPVVRTSSGRQRYSVLGAIGSHSHEFISVRTKGNVNSPTVIDLLFEIRSKHPRKEVTLILDNAKYQKNPIVREVAASYGIAMEYLPSYSPNLNLIERLWKLTKKECLTNRFYDSFAKFIAAIDNCLDSIPTTLMAEVKSLLSLKFQFFPIGRT